MSSKCTTFCTVLLLGSVAYAQNGDRPGETQPPLPEAFDRPASPPRTPEEELASFTLQPGFKAQLVAAEPLIGDPVAMAFDESGRLWVVEMRGYMNDIDGSDETQPVGRIVVLEDADGDGQMESSTVFLDGLVLPRAISPCAGGALFVEPPHLVFARDLDGDGAADTTRVLASGFGGIHSPEHAGNGLAWGLDGWLECSQHGYRFRFHDPDGPIEVQRVRSHGQWGVAVDDFGRCWYSPNSEPLLVDLHPKHYAVRNPNQSGFHGVGQAVAASKRVHPVARTPGVNRGYQKNLLDDKGRLRNFTGACGTGVYRDTLLGNDVEGDVFVCEVSGNLIKRFDIQDDPQRTLRGVPVDADGEFMASTDERFRPVQVVTGPDGALYVCDMYRGIIQHRLFMTTFLRNQVIDRGLDVPTGLGRIWRIVPDDGETRGVEDLADASDEELAIFVEHPNGTVRDSAQRLLIEHEATSTSGVLRDGLADSPLERDRLRMLWTLAGLGEANDAVLAMAMNDSSAHVRRAALRIAEDAVSSDELVSLCKAAMDDPDEFVRVQSALSIGEAEQAEAMAMLVALFAKDERSRSMRSAVLSSLGGREVEFLTLVEQDDLIAERTASSRTILADLADAVLRSRNREQITALFSFAAQRPAEREWQTRTVLDRVGAAMKLNSKTPRKVRVGHPPEGWAQLLALGKTPLGQRALAIDEHLLWPQREMVLAEDEGHDVNFDDIQSVIARGRRVYVQCLSCHQANGRGLYPVYPPLADSEYVLGDPSLLAAIIMRGVEGRITVDGRVFNQLMPPAPVKDHQDIAAVMTYIRQAWGNDATGVTPEMVSESAAQYVGHNGPLGPEDLK